MNTERNEKPDPAIQAQLEWHRVKAQKGYSPETLNLLFYEFVKSRGLFKELIKFVLRKE